MDYIGVIVGPDLVVRDGQVITRPEMRSRQDQSIKGWKAETKRDPEGARKKADAIVRNTYRTLMTRGMKGCLVYCVDRELRRHLYGRMAHDRHAVPESRAAEEKARYRVED